MLQQAVVAGIVMGLCAAACLGRSCAEEAQPGEVVKPLAWEVALQSTASTAPQQGRAASEEAPPTQLSPEARIPLALPKRSHATHRPTAPMAVTRPSVVSIVGSLLLVCGLFVALIWAMRYAMPRSQAPLPTEVVCVLGRASLSARHVLQLLQVGNKLVLVAVGPTGVHTVTEVSNGDEVTRLLGLCQQHQRGSITASFRQILQQPSEAAEGTTRGRSV